MAVELADDCTAAEALSFGEPTELSGGDDENGLLISLSQLHHMTYYYSSPQCSIVRKRILYGIVLPHIAPPMSFKSSVKSKNAHGQVML